MKTIRISLVTVGLAMMAFALGSAVTGGGHFKPSRHVLFLIAVLVLHDGVLLPFFIVIGVLVRRFVPVRERAVVQGALIVSAAVTFVALPFVLGEGRTPGLPSALPRDYPGGLALVLTAVWLAAAGILAARYLTRRSVGRRRSARGQAYQKLAPVADVADGDRAPMGFDQATDDREP
jgi:hypothetical protein